MRMRRSLHVCFLTHYYPPEAGAPQTRIELLARMLASRGAQVTVHTGFPHYPTGQISPPYRNRPWRRERRDGVEVFRSAVYPARNAGFAGRLLDHAAFASSALATAPLTPPADVVLAETPPLFCAAAGVGYARIKHAAYVVNVADLWPESAVALGALSNHRAIAVAAAMERWIYRRADAIVAPTRGIVERLAATTDARAKARRLWPVVDLDRFHVESPPFRHDGIRQPLRVLFAGTVGLAHGVEVLVEASRLAGPEVVQTTIAGAGAEAERIRTIVHQRQVANVRMLGSVAPERIPELYAAADAGAVLLRDLELFRAALPTKLLEVMAAGRAALVAARGESAELVAQAQAGLVVQPGDPDALAAACVQLHADRDLAAALGQAGRRFAEAHFGADRAADAWAEELERAVRSSRVAL
jgi:glycosyltransferase involved in cell wall biosynthesis